MDPFIYCGALAFWLVVLIKALRVPRPYEKNIMGAFRDLAAWRFSLPYGVACILFLFGIQLWILGNKMKGVSPGDVTPPVTGIGLVIQACFFAPIFEEMIFRGLLFRWLQRGRIGPLFSLLLSSGAFCLLHPHQIDAFFFGVVMCLLVYLTDNAWPGVLLHGFNNFLNLVPRLFWREIPAVVLTHLHFAGGVLIVIFFPGFLLLALRAYRRYSPRSPRNYL